MNYMEHLLREDLNRDWLSLMLIGAIVLLGIMRYRFPKRTVELMLLPINDKYFALEGRQKGLKHPFDISMLLVQIMAFGLLLVLIMQHADPTRISLDFNLFVKACLLTSIYLMVRHVLDWTIGYVFNCQKLLATYRYQRMSFHHLISVVVLILFSALFFVRVSFEVITLVISLLVIFSLFATLIYGLRRNSTTLITNFLYFILYICALEIAPYALLYQAAKA